VEETACQELTVKEKSLTKDRFDRLLEWLSPDRNAAAQKYEEIRRRLIYIFDCLGCPVSEDLADRTFDIVCEKVSTVAAGYSGDPARYFFGVGHKVHLEYKRKSHIRPIDPPPGPDPEIELRDQCLQECLANLPPETREMVVDYYREEKRAMIENRKRIAARLGIPLSALRLRVYRIREGLEEDVRECIRRNQI
jgi:DNA-directed RNA polymerase specialized sigma24 family protein